MNILFFTFIALYCILSIIVFFRFYYEIMLLDKIFWIIIFIIVAPFIEIINWIKNYYEKF